MLLLGQYGLRHGVDIKINWPGRISVFPIMGGIWLALLAPGWVATALVVWGVAMALLATYMYAQDGLRAVRAAKGSACGGDLYLSRGSAGSAPAIPPPTSFKPSSEG